MPVLSDSSVEVNVRTTSDQSGINDTEKAIAGLGDTAGNTQSKVSDFTDNFTSGMHKVAAVTGVAGAGLTLYAKTGVDKLTELVKSSKALSRQTGMTTEDSSKLVAAMGRLGVNADQAAVSFRTFSKNINEARESTGDNALKQQELANKIKATELQITTLNKKMRDSGDTSGELKNKIEGLNIQLQTYRKSMGESETSLGKLGIATQDSTGKNKDFADILYEVSDRFQSMPDGAEKTSIAVDLFGRSGTEMIKVLNGGSEALKKLEADAEKMGLTLNSTNIGVVNDYIKSQKELTATTESLQIAVGTLTAPLLTEFNNGLNNVLTSVIGVDSPLRGVAAGFLAFGGPVLGAIGVVAEFSANIAGAIPLLGALRGAIMSPFFMPAIVLTAFLASVAIISSNISKVNSEFDALDKEMEDSDRRTEELKNQYKSGLITKDQFVTGMRDVSAQADKTSAKADELKNKYSNLNNYLKEILPGFREIDSFGNFFQNLGKQAAGKSGAKGGGGFATGGYTGQGGVNEVKGLVHAGEYVLPQSQVNQSTGLPKAGALGGGNYTTTNRYDIGQVVLSSGDAVREFFALNDSDTQSVKSNLTPSRGSI